MKLGECYGYEADTKGKAGPAAWLVPFLAAVLAPETTFTPGNQRHHHDPPRPTPPSSPSLAAVYTTHSLTRLHSLTRIDTPHPRPAAQPRWVRSCRQLLATTSPHPTRLPHVKDGLRRLHDDMRKDGDTAVCPRWAHLAHQRRRGHTGEVLLADD